MESSSSESQPKFKHAMPKQRFLVKILNPATRSTVDLSKCRFDHTKIQQLIDLYDATAAAQENRIRITEFIRSEAALSIYGLRSLPTSERKKFTRHAFYKAKNSCLIPKELLYDSSGRKKRIRELKDDTSVQELISRKPKTGNLEGQFPGQTTNARSPSIEGRQIKSIPDQSFRSIGPCPGLVWSNFDMDPRTSCVVSLKNSLFSSAFEFMKEILNCSFLEQRDRNSICASSRDFEYRTNIGVHWQGGRKKSKERYLSS
jgi:hypothetical protein